MKHRLNYIRHREPIHGFTLIELLVVIAIIALLLAILQPSLQKVKEQARLVVCKTKMKQVHLALQMYATDNKERYPICSGWDGRAPNKTQIESGRYGILEIAKEGYLGRAMNNGESGIDKALAVFFCPSSRRTKDWYRPWLLGNPDSDKIFPERIDYYYLGANGWISSSPWPDYKYSPAGLSHRASGLIRAGVIGTANCRSMSQFPLLQDQAESSMENISWHKGKINVVDVSGEVETVTRKEHDKDTENTIAILGINDVTWTEYGYLYVP